MTDAPSPPRPRPKRSEIRRARRRSLLRRKRGPGTPSSGPRWKRRTLIGAGSLLGIIVLFVAGAFFYARWRFDQIAKEKVNGLQAISGNQPFNVLLVGSDSRAFVDSPGDVASFGSQVSGQRSDVIIIARIVPATRQLKLLSIPRDTWVDIPGSGSTAGANRINAAFNSGPSLLVKTISNDFHIPINYFAAVNFPGFAKMVNALGGIDLDFSDPVKDSYSGLNITRTGCQLVNGAQALGLVRSRHLEYYTDGYWHYDGLSDFSRIQRQDAFFRAVISKVKDSISLTSVFTLNSFVGAAAKDLTLDQTLSEGAIIGLARDFQGFSSSELATETLPTIPFTTAGGAAVLAPAQLPDEAMIARFLSFGTTSTNSAVAARTSAVVHLAPGANASLTAAKRAPTSLVPVTTIPSNASTNPADVVYNTQPEPWNPTPCNL